MSETGKVYAIGDENGYVKIGRTEGSAEHRLRTFQTGNRAGLTLLAECCDDTPSDTERHFHACLREIGMGERGEWFILQWENVIAVGFYNPLCHVEQIWDFDEEHTGGC